MQSTFRGATVWPFLGVLPSVLFHWGHLYDWLTRLLILNGGTFRLPGPWKRILTADPANIVYLMRTKYHNFGKGEITKDMFRDLFGESILLQDGDSFKRLSVPVLKAFSSPAFRNSVAAALPAVMQRNLLPVFTNASQKSSIIDLQSLFHRSACYNAWLFSVALELDCLSPNLPRVPFLEAFLAATQSIMFRLLMPPFCWKVLRFFNVLYERRFLKAKDFAYAFVLQQWNSRESANQNSSPLSDMASTFLRYEEERGQIYSQKYEN